MPLTFAVVKSIMLIQELFLRNGGTVMKNSILSRLRTLLVLSLALVLVLSLTGCFQKEDTPTDDPKDPTTQVDPTGDAEPTDEPTEEPTEAPTEAPTAPPQKSEMGTVTANNLNVRSNPSNSGSTIIGQLPVDLRVEILEQKTETVANANGTTTTYNWGRIGEMILPNGTKVPGGWINLSYVKLDGAEPEKPTTDPADPTDAPVVEGTGKKGTVTADVLIIRKGTSTKTEQVGTYMEGDVVEILEQKTVDGTTWGRTNKGWVSMKYIKLEGQTTTPDDDKDDDKTTSELVTDGKTKVLGYGVIDLGSLNVRTGPGTKYDKIDVVSEGTRYAYYQKSGNWVRIKNGWVSISYFYIEGTTADDACTGTVTATELNIRKGPGTGYDKTGTFKQGDTVKVLGQVGKWGYTSKGWINMDHVKVETTKPTYTTGKGTNTTDVNIRKEPDAKSEKVGLYKKGDKVTITEVKDGWGKTDKGWVKLDYVKMDPVPTYTTGTGTVTGVLNIRKAPNGEKTGKAYKKGDKVEITKVEGEWGQTKDGWISLKYVKMDPPAEKEPDEVGKNTEFKVGKATVVVNSSLTVRKTASTSADKVASLKNGTKVDVKEVSGEWGKIEYKTGEFGWINLRYVKYD